MAKSPDMLAAEVNAWIGEDDGFIDPATIVVGLYLTPPVNPNTILLADFGIPSGGNYPAIVPGDVAGPHLRLDGRVSITLSGLQFEGDADQLPQTFAGCYVKTSLGSTNVLAWVAFDQPLVFVSTSNMAQLTVRLSNSNPVGNVEVTVVNG